MRLRTTSAAKETAMKVTCIGTDPAGLYLGILLKRRDPSHVVRFIDSGPQPSAQATIICNPLKPRLTLADAETFEAIKPAIASFDRVSIDAEGRTFETKGLRYATIDRTALLQALKQRASELGCIFDRRALTGDDRRADLLVAADGPDSESRASAGLTAELSRSSNRTVVFQSVEPADALSYSFQATEHGIFHAWKLPRGSNGSSVIVETPAETLRVSGLDRAPPECIIALCRKLFSLQLDRIVAAADGSTWESFATVRNRIWHTGNVALLGRAAYSSHGSVGLDLRSQLEDAETLAEHLSSGASVPDALAAFEAARRPKAESLQRASDASLTWFEHVRRYRALPFEQFCFSLLTNSMRLTYARIEKAAPDLVRTIDTLLASATPESNRPPPPMFAPIRLRGLTIPNRVVVSPMCQYSATDGTVSDWHLVHLGSRAIGGAGLIIAEMTDVLPEGRISLHCAGMYKAEHVPAWKRVTDFVHANSESKIAVQLAHAGRKGSLTRSWEGHKPLGEAKWELIAPSPLAFAEGRQVPREMTRADMDKVRDAFVRATGMSDAAGFDMIELHYAHGYLMSSFISPLTNRRADEYGGPLENRMRFPLEVFNAVRATWPAHKPISTRISSVDWLDGGTTIEDAIEIARMLHAAGNDILAVSTGGVSSEQRPVEGRAFQAIFSDQIRNELGIPTVAVGGIVSHADVNTIVAAGRADMCALGRGYLEDAYFPRHAARAQSYTGLKWPSQYRRAGEVQLRGE
jgi:anthraniloyl-CoA monooxygenase